MTENNPKKEVEDAKIIDFPEPEPVTAKDLEGTERKKIRVYDKIIVSNNRTDKKLVFKSNNNFGLTWDYHLKDQSLLVIVQLLPGKIKNREGGDVQDWAPVAHLKDYSIMGFEFVEV